MRAMRIKPIHSRSLRVRVFCVRWFGIFTIFAHFAIIIIIIVHRDGVMVILAYYFYFYINRALQQNICAIVHISQMVYVLWSRRVLLSSFRWTFIYCIKSGFRETLVNFLQLIYSRKHSTKWSKNSWTHVVCVCVCVFTQARSKRIHLFEMLNMNDGDCFNRMILHIKTKKKTKMMKNASALEKRNLDRFSFQHTHCEHCAYWFVLVSARRGCTFVLCTTYMAYWSIYTILLLLYS